MLPKKRTIKSLRENIPHENRYSTEKKKSESNR